MPDGSARLRGRPIGAHAPTLGGLASGSLRYAAAVGAEAIQVFVANPRSWALTRRDAAQQAAQEEALREAAAEARMPVFVHAPYLVNVASPDPRLRALSAGSIRHSLARGAAIGARGVVVHTGSATDGNRDGGLARARECLLPILAGIGADAPDLLLEPMAGQGNALCSLVADLGPYLDALSWHPRAGICLDTCHLFAAGHDLAGPGRAGHRAGRARCARGRAAPARACQRLTGLLRLDAGPSRGHRPGPDRHGRVRQPAEPPGDRRGGLRGRDSWRCGRSGRRHRGPA